MSNVAHERIPALTLGWRLRMALAASGMSVQEMADELGVARGTLSRWMASEGAPPRRVYILQWAAITDVDLAWLEHGVTPPSGGPEPVGRTAGADDDSDEARELAERKRRRRGTAGPTIGIGTIAA